ncbi:MAG: hypothetical protein HY841_03540 [Bacteroidetes bacterium]|nr:hypothetical protein [Bacteroidota bacterium]
MNIEVKAKLHHSKFLVRYSLFILFISPFVFSSCRHTRYLTEQYIKTNIEEHAENEFSRLETYSIFQKHLHNQSGSFKGFAYLELTGYKHKGKTGMVIGAEKYHFNGKRLFKLISAPLETNYTYINLDINQCKSLLSNYKELRQKIVSEKAKPFEVIYHDFNTSKDFYISYKAVLGKPKTKYIDFWIKGERYRIKSRVFMKKFMKFMKYYASE